MTDPTHKKVAIGILIVALVLMLAIHFSHHESFANKREKATAIFNWFKGNRSPSYVRYKSDLKGASNIVEYSDVMKLLRERNLAIGEIERVI